MNFVQGAIIIVLLGFMATYKHLRANHKQHNINPIFVPMINVILTIQINPVNFQNLINTNVPRNTAGHQMKVCWIDRQTDGHKSVCCTGSTKRMTENPSAMNTSNTYNSFHIFILHVNSVDFQDVVTEIQGFKPTLLA